MKIKINEKKVKKIITTTFLSTLAVTTVGFTMFGIGAGGSSNGLSQITIKEGFSSELKTNVEKINQEIKKLPFNSGYLETHGNNIDVATVTAVKTAINAVSITGTDQYSKDVKKSQDKLVGILTGIETNEGKILDNTNKEIKDNKTFFNIGVCIFSLGLVALIASIAYYSYFKHSLKNN